MVKINDFSGGISRVLSADVIQHNEAIYYVNIDNLSNTLKPARDAKVIEDELDTGYIGDFLGTIVKDEDKRTYAIYNETIYSTLYDEVNYENSTTKPKKSTDGVEWFDIGLFRPGISLYSDSTDDDSGLKGIYTHCYTYYNSDDGIESVPSNITSSVKVNMKGIKLGNISKSLDEKTTNIRIYRQGGAIPTMQLVATISNSDDDYIDLIADVDIQGNSLDSIDNNQPDKNMRYITEHNSMLFGTVGNTLRYSDIGKCEYWSAFNIISFDDKITGIGSTQNGLLVFTKYKTYIISGTSPDTFSKYLLSGSQGCIAHNVVKNINKYLIWVSLDGICISDGGTVTVMSNNKLGKDYNYTNLYTEPSATVSDDTYYLSTGINILAVDFKKPTPVFKQFNTMVTDIITSKNEIYYTVRDGDKFILYKMFDTEHSYYRPVYFKSGMYISSVTEFIPVNINITSVGEFIIEVYMDNVIIITSTISTVHRHTTELLDIDLTGHNIEVDITSKDNAFFEIYDISFDTYDKSSIASTTKFYSTTEFKEIVKINGQPLEFDKTSYGYASHELGIEPTELKLFDRLKIKYKGQVDLVATFDADDVLITLDSTDVNEEIIRFRDMPSYSLKFDISDVGDGKVYDISFDTYNKSNIGNSLKFYNTQSFKEIVKVNKQPIEFDKTATGYVSPEINIEPTELKLFDNLKIKYIGTITLTSILDGVELVTVLDSTILNEEIITFQDKVGYSLKFDIVGDGKVYDISFDTYNKSNIGNSLKFYNTQSFKEIVKVNKQPIEFDKTATGYVSTRIPLIAITKHKLFKNIFVAYIGEVNIKLYLDDKLVIDKYLDSDTIETKELLIPSSKSRAYFLSIEYEGNGRLYDVEIEPSEVNQ